MTTIERLDFRTAGFKPRMTEEEFEAWALQTETPAEWIDGEVFLMSPASEEHVEIVHWLQTLLGMYVAKHRLGKVMATEFMVRLPKGRRLPDVLYVREGSTATFTRTYLDGAPDLAVEIVSPDSRVRDREGKFTDYQNAGVQEYWIIDPATRRADFYTLEAAKYKALPVDGAGIFRSLVVPGFWIKTEWLWMHPSPNVYELAQTIGIV